MLVTIMSFLAWSVTPWAILGLLFLAGWKEGSTVTIEKNNTTVTVEIDPESDLTQRDIRSTIHSAMEEIE